MTRRLGSALFLVLLASPLLADSIDDAEAKRRGVPVAQVQAENALAKEKVKTADLEKQIAALKKQLADLQNPGNATPATASMPAAATATRVASPTPATGPSATTAARAASPTPATGPADTTPYTVHMDRTPVLVSYLTHFAVERSYTTTHTSLSGKVTSDKFSLKGDISARQFINRIANGQVAERMLDVKSFTVNGKESYPAGKPIYVQCGTTLCDYLPPMGGDINFDTRQALDLIYPYTDSTPPNEDDIFGTKTPQKINEEWPIDNKLAARWLGRIALFEMDPAHFTGKAKITAVETINNAKAIRITISINATNFMPAPPHPGWIVAASEFHGTLTRLVPLDPAVPIIESSHEYDDTMTETSPTEGQFVSVMHVSKSEVISPTPPPAGK